MLNDHNIFYLSRTYYFGLSQTQKCFQRRVGVSALVQWNRKHTAEYNQQQLVDSS